MSNPGLSRMGRVRIATLFLLTGVVLCTTLGCGGGGREDRAMIDPAKAADEQKAADDARRQNYTPDKMKPKNARR